MIKFSKFINGGKVKDKIKHVENSVQKKLKILWKLLNNTSMIYTFISFQILKGILKSKLIRNWKSYYNETTKKLKKQILTINVFELYTGSDIIVENERKKYYE